MFCRSGYSLVAELKKIYVKTVDTGERDHCVAVAAATSLH